MYECVCKKKKCVILITWPTEVPAPSETATNMDTMERLSVGNKSPSIEKTIKI